jgi:hypothetical protein
MAATVKDEKSIEYEKAEGVARNGPNVFDIPIGFAR